MCFEHWICSSGSTDKHTRSVLFGSADRLNLQLYMLDLNTGFAVVVKPLPDGTFSSIMGKQGRNTLFRFMNTLVQFCGEHAGSVSCRFCVGFALA